MENFFSLEFILGNNKAIDNTVLMLIYLKLISKVTNIINKIKYYIGCRGSLKLRSYTISKLLKNICEGIYF